MTYRFELLLRQDVTKAIHISKSHFRSGYDSSAVVFNNGKFLGVWLQKRKADHFFQSRHFW